ncbi:hypothetical protein JCM8202_004676 [Rhodotorula sphaerocarpa]
MASGVFSAGAARLAGKTVLVTGASGGIGAATAIAFARAGASLILTARRQAQLDEVKKAALEAHKEGATGKGGRIECLQLDMQDRAAIKGLLDRIPEELKNVDILVNNAGLVYGKEHVGDIDSDEIDIMFQTNVLGLITLTQILVKEFKKRNKGHIINLGSIAGLEPYAGGSIYTATKHAVRAFSGSMLRELVGYNIRVSDVNPGMVQTDFSVTRFRGDQAAADKVYEGLKPLVAQDIAEEILWIASRPEHVNVADMLVFPSAQASATINHRGPQGPPGSQ